MGTQRKRKPGDRRIKPTELAATRSQLVELSTRVESTRAHPSRGASARVARPSDR
jgi:hypothetical protein